MTNLPQGVTIDAEITPEFAEILTPEALALVAKLSRAFEPRRQQLLADRVERAKRLDAGERPDFLPETKHIRDGDWKIAPRARGFALSSRRDHRARSRPRWSSTRSIRARTAT